MNEKATLVVLAGLLVSTAQSAEPTGTLTLACQGEKSSRGAPGSGIAPVQEQASMGLIVNFAAQTVSGFGGDWPFPIPMRNLSETAIVFGDERPGLTGRIIGSIDRVTGEMEAGLRSEKFSVSYSLKCKPTQRMF
jgi:hypothetical protein